MTDLKGARVSVVGLGLMGGSLAASLKAAGACCEVLGVARRQWSIDRAKEQGWIDGGTTDLRQAASLSDIVVVATPVRTIVELVGDDANWQNSDCLLMDLGSTKRDVVAMMERLPVAIEPVGGHPMCGKALSGLDAAEMGLYQDATFVLVPLPRTSSGTLALARQLVVAVGAHPLIMEADRHDRLVGAVSHLPYCVASALIQTVDAVAARDDLVWQLAASGLYDTTRLAASDVTMMLDILLTNRTVVVDLLHRYSQHIDHWLGALRSGDESELEQMLRTASCTRRDRMPSMERTSE
jgi:prephenate dehydrogenase